VETDSLDVRLGRLERQCRRWRWAGLIFAIIVGTPVLALLVAFVTLDGTREAKRVLIRDKDGRIRIDMGTWKDGTPRLLFAGASGKPRLEIRVGTDEAPMMEMLDESGKVRLSMVVGKEGPTLNLNDKEEKARLTMMSAGDSMSGVVLYDMRGKLRAMLSIEENGSPVLRFTDSDEKPRMAIVVDTDSLPSLGMIDKDGKIRFAVQLDKDGNPVGLRTRP
jgi:hypothetical protein